MSRPRIAQSDLQAIVNRLNREAGAVAGAPGSYQLSSAYGGWALYRIRPTGGTVDAINSGHVPARELQALMFAYIAGQYSAEAPTA
jgi:hypothetical protein